jgi:putative ABC transport system permease protein
VVGVAANVPVFGLREELKPLIYVPVTALPGTPEVQTVRLLLRTDVAPLTLAPLVHETIGGIDAHAPVLAARTMSDVLAESVADVTFTSAVLALAALLALLLGAIGLYGVIAYAVARRRSEIGMRVALGATPADIRSLVLREGAALAALGIILGLIGAFMLTRLLESMLFETSAHDPLTFVAVAALLTTVTLLASWLPARSATRIDPLEAIRSIG